jgi:16S rRNA C967 or C1407 C5-methylase (RsmB/RsmF family)/NOL1/NOP2/fmu family ribosome biogenesis protein
LQNLNPDFIQQIRLLYPKASESFFTAMSEAALTSVRLNPFKTTGVFENETLIPWCEEGRILQNRPSFIADPLFHAGSYYVQESSSMFLKHALETVFKLLREPKNQNLKVLDLCAAPGGKSTLIASTLEKDDFLLANEIIRTRFPVLKENLIKWGTINYACSSLDPKAFKPLTSFFDVIVADAPCSGEGLFRKDPSAMNEWSLQAVDMCAARQKRIIEDIIPSLKPGGILIYSTCTFNKKEDEEQIQYLINQGFETIPLNIPSDWNIEECENHSYKFPYHLQKGEGFFIACLRKPDETEGRVTYKHKSLSFCNKNTAAPIKEWFLPNSDFAITNYGDTYYAMEESHTRIFEVLIGSGIIQTAGIPVGELDKKKQLIPEHELALSIHKNKSIQKAELSLEQAHLFLRKQNLLLNDLEPGWYLAAYQSMSMGWIKVLGNRVNNYLPSNYRVLKEL